jgi:hypothetical protein
MGGLRLLAGGGGGLMFGVSWILLEPEVLYWICAVGYQVRSKEFCRMYLDEVGVFRDFTVRSSISS